MTPTQLLLVEQWFDNEAMNSHLSSERFRAAIGPIKVLGKLIDIQVSEARLIEGG
jgi:quinol monooxygenase YgiN